MQAKWLVAVVAGAGVVTFCGAVLWRFAFFIAPYTWTGEPARLLDVLGVAPGASIADIGAGDGSMAVAMAHGVGPNGVVYATELSPDQRREIAARAGRAGTPQIRVVEGAENTTNLPPACCDAIYLRAVFHHLGNRAAFAQAITRALKPGGRVAVIDFPPGSLWFHGSDHGVTAQAVMEAFRGTGLSPSRQIEDWGGGMFLLVFERARPSGTN
jgi:ubiquinone/menaquinone biosynthesis C-methylase UbiE